MNAALHSAGSRRNLTILVALPALFAAALTLCAFLQLLPAGLWWNALVATDLDDPRQLLFRHTEAVLGVYELNRIDLLKDLFLWAYERSAARYAAVRQSLGEPDPFRLRYQEELRELIAALICGRTGRQKVTAHIADWAAERINSADRERFVEIAEAELTGLHEGNFARYRIRPSEFSAWREVWEAK
jgi:hypothetical protein